ncbi:putative BOP1 domain-containing protein [Helianthus anomalus]
MTPPSSHPLRHRFISSQPPHPPPRFARPNNHLRLPQDVSNIFVISLLYGLLSPTLCSLTSFGLKILLGFILRFTSLRSVPAYEKSVWETFDRCLDLYLFPRARKKRVATVLDLVEETLSHDNSSDHGPKTQLQKPIQSCHFLHCQLAVMQPPLLLLLLLLQSLQNCTEAVKDSRVLDFGGAAISVH